MRAPQLSSRMDMIAAGPPSVLGTWAFNLLKEACSSLAEEVEVRLLDRFDRIDGLGLALGRARILCLSQFPSASLRMAAAGRAPCVTFFDDPVDSVRYLKMAARCSTLEALRVQSASIASCLPLAGGANTLVIHRAAGGGGGELIRRCLRHLGLQPPPAVLAGLIARYAGDDHGALSLEACLARHVAGHRPLGPEAPGLDKAEIDLVLDALSPIVPTAPRRDDRPVIWPARVFFSGDQPGEPAAPIAEITGGARILYYGPYFHLPVGAWNADVVIEFTDETRGAPFSIEVHAGRLLARATMRSGGVGVFRGAFSFEHDEPHDPVEIQLRSDEGAIDGRIALRGVEFRPRATAGPRRRGGRSG